MRRSPGKIDVWYRDLTILNVVWTPGMAVYPQDHRMWAVIGLYGGREDGRRPLTSRSTSPTEASR